jgi:hypothetical protein
MSLLNLNKAWAEANGTVIGADIGRQAALFKKTLKDGKRQVFEGGGTSLAGQHSLAKGCATPGA